MWPINIELLKSKQQTKEQTFESCLLADVVGDALTVFYEPCAGVLVA